MSGEGDSTSDLSTQLATLLKNGLNTQPQNPKLSDNLVINLKLNSQNYALWTRMIRVAIGGKSKKLLNHLGSDPPDRNDPTYEQWEQDDLVVFSWLIQNIEPTLASKLTEFPTAKTLWEALSITYSSGRDKLHAFNLHVRANEIKQNDLSLEGLWITFQGIWGEIDRIDPNPMKSPEDIKTYTQKRSEQKLFQFLNALDRKYESITREILRSDPPPTVEQAYALVRKEESHQKILNTNLRSEGVAAGLTVTESGSGYATKSNRRVPLQKSDKTNLKCSHCGMTRHTKEECFKLVGYPEWWNDGHKKGKQSGGNHGGRAAAAVGSDEPLFDGSNHQETVAAQEDIGGSGNGGCGSPQSPLSNHIHELRPLGLTNPNRRPPPSLLSNYSCDSRPLPQFLEREKLTKALPDQMPCEKRPDLTGETGRPTDTNPNRVKGWMTGETGYGENPSNILLSPVDRPQIKQVSDLTNSAPEFCNRHKDPSSLQNQFKTLIGMANMAQNYEKKGGGIGYLIAGRPTQ